MRWLTVFLAAIAFALIGVGCGGSDDSAATADTTVQEETTTDETTTEEGTTQASDLSFTSKDCLAFIGAAAAVGQAFSGATGDVDQSKFFTEYADRVPDDIKADFQTLADGGAAAAAAYAKLNLAPGETPSATQLQQYQADLAAIDQEEFSAASERISAWTTEVCPSG
jgi:hypothetical protein